MATINPENSIYTRIPLRKNLFNYEFSIVIKNTIYIIRVYYNRRSSKWLIDIKDENNDSIVMSIPLLIGAQLTKRFVDERLEDAKYLFIYNTKDIYENPTTETLGDTCNLYVANEIEE